MKDNKSLMMIAGGLFIASVIMKILEILFGMYSPSIWFFMGIISFVIIGTGLLLNNPSLTGIGGCVEIILLLASSVYIMQKCYLSWDETIGFIVRRSVILEWLLFTIAMFMKKKTSFYLCIAAVVIGAISRFVNFRVNFSFLIVLLSWVGIILAGKAVSEWSPATVPAAASNVAKSASIGDTAERIAKLKSLLDSGVITQEEFDTKKKEILQ